MRQELSSLGPKVEGLGAAVKENRERADQNAADILASIRELGSRGGPAVPKPKPQSKDRSRSRSAGQSSVKSEATDPLADDACSHKDAMDFLNPKDTSLDKVDITPAIGKHI